MSLAILNAQNQVVTFVRNDVPEGWKPPEGCTAIPESELPPGWQRADSTPTGPRSQKTRTILDRLTPAEAEALMNCTQWQVRLLVSKATAAGTIDETDPDFPTAKTALDSLGILAASRWDALFSENA